MFYYFKHNNIYEFCIGGLNKLKDEFDLQDFWRVQNPERREFTWKSKHKKEHKASRLDRFYSSDTMSLISQRIHRIAQSDHAIVVSRYNIPTDAPRGPGYWKLNKKILKDANYKEKMINIYRNMPYDEQNPNLWWDNIKATTKYYTIEYCKRRKRKINEYICISIILENL